MIELLHTNGVGFLYMNVQSHVNLWIDGVQPHSINGIFNNYWADNTELTQLFPTAPCTTCLCCTYM